MTFKNFVFTTNFVYLAYFMSVKLLMRPHMHGFREWYECSFNYNFKIIPLQFTFYETKRRRKKKTNKIQKNGNILQDSLKFPFFPFFSVSKKKEKEEKRRVVTSALKVILD